MREPIIFIKRNQPLHEACVPLYCFGIEGKMSMLEHWPQSHGQPKKLS